MATSTPIQEVAVLGAGLIGASWSALFSANGCHVRVFDVNAEQQDYLTDYVESVQGNLRMLLGIGEHDFGAIEFGTDLRDAVEAAPFVMECAPERLDLKHDLYGQVEPHLGQNTILATSSSGLMLSELQLGLKNPGPLILAHPFNPPHLVPLVELQVNERTRPDVLSTARDFLEHCGKKTIEVKREIPGHIANRLQAAIWREAIALVEGGVATVEDVDRAVVYGPGLRWSIMGPHMLFELGSAKDGISGYAHHFSDSYHRWWSEMGQSMLTDETIAILQAGVDDEKSARSPDDLRQERDRKLVAVLRVLNDG